MTFFCIREGHSALEVLEEMDMNFKVVQTRTVICAVFSLRSICFLQCDGAQPCSAIAVKWRG